MRYFDYYRKGKATILPSMAKIHEGLAIQGLERSKSFRNGESYDFALCWGWRQDERLDMLGWQGPRLYAEMGYVSAAPRYTDQHGYKDFRIANISFCWDGCHGLGFDYLPARVPSDRFEKLGLDIQPWRVGGSEIVVVGQTELDPVAIPPGEERAWNERLVPRCQAAWPGKAVRFRPHPRYTNFEGPPLVADCGGAYSAVTYSSTSAVELVLAGIPTCTLSEVSIAYPVCAHSLGERVMPDRADWAYKLAYRQWNFDELASGEFWETVKRGLRSERT